MTVGVDKQSSLIRNAFRVLVWNGLLLVVAVILTSGYMVSATNTDTFCAGCHVMTPFRNSWSVSVHGGRNQRGIVVQCISCHLPHDTLVHFVGVKIVRGIRDIIRNVSIDGKMYDWAGNARRNRSIFTYDSGCMSCHEKLFSLNSRQQEQGLRALCTGRPGKQPCTSCHPNVGHREVVLAAEEFFHRISELGVP